MQSGIAYITASFNNTIVTITDVSGNVVSWSSSGVKGFKGSRKSTPFAAQLAADDAAHKAMEHGMKSINVFIRGPGFGPRVSAARACVGRVQDQCDPGSHPHSAQRLQAAQAAQGLRGLVWFLGQ